VSAAATRERVTVVKRRCGTCGSDRVRSIFTGAMVIRECADCESRRGSYTVKTTPAWARA
jgi:hypothetical protein